MELFVSTLVDGVYCEPGALEPAPLYFSTSHEASVRCMMGVPPECNGLVAQVRDTDGMTVCDSGLVSLKSDQWVCLHAEADCDGMPSSKLLSFTEDYEDGWTLCFDLKERSGQASVLRHVHVIHRPKLSTSECEDNASCEITNSQIDRTDLAGCVDCTDAEASPFFNTHFKKFTSFGGVAPGNPNRQQILLQDMLSCIDKPLPPRLLETAFWNSFSQGLTVISEDRLTEDLAPVSPIAFEHVDQARSQLQQCGHGRFTDVAWSRRHISMQALSDTIDALQNHGFPPVFIFMYEEAWTLWESLFDVMSQLLDNDDLELDASIFAWSLQPAGKKTKAIGNNFGQPHRDNSYDECHTADGKLTILSVWLPLVPVTTDNGCMCVVPSDRDALFDQPDDPFHMQPQQRMPWAHIRCLPANAGDILFWKSNLIHWGTSCSANADCPPRKSLASAFMVGGVCKESTILRSQLKSGLSLQQRLHLIFRGLLIYEHWHPDFEGLDELLKGSP